MVKHYDTLDEIYHALADPTRREMVARLRERPLSISELAMPFDMTLAAIGKLRATEELSV